eukprot:TRINITY_DN1125_c0_g1_i2.p1 TRINITY_DN1125_c0_g1~~TRINITY_DN1125_c0_g1_i2.p1  ORF type:complete len:717 (+),score=35.89 TRINITY_DN1125_c0_g1_i2:148-2298(+)
MTGPISSAALGRGGPEPARAASCRSYVPCGGVLPGTCAGGLWDATHNERHRSWNKILSHSSRPVPETVPLEIYSSLHHTSSVSRNSVMTSPVSPNSVMKRGDMEVPCRWEVALVRESSEGQRRRAASVDYNALACARNRSASDASSSHEQCGRSSFQRQSTPCDDGNLRNRIRDLFGGGSLGPRSSSESPAGRNSKRRPSDPWSGRCEPAFGPGGISCRQRSTSSRRTESTALYNSPKRATSRSLPRERLGVETLLWGSSALPVDCPVPALFGETPTPRDYIQPRVGMARRASLPAKQESTEFITDPLIKGVAHNHQEDEARQEPSASNNQIAKRNPISLAEEQPVPTGPSKPYRGMNPPFDDDRQQSPRDVAVPGMSRKLNGSVNRGTIASEVNTYECSAGAVSAKQPYHSTTRPALYRYDCATVTPRKSIDCLRAESMEPPASSQQTVKQPKVPTRTTASVPESRATERSPSRTTRVVRGPASSTEARGPERSPVVAARPTKGSTISPEARATERSPATTTRATKDASIRADACATENSLAMTTSTTRGPTISAEARATERSPATTARATKDTSISAKACAMERSRAMTTGTTRGPIISAEACASEKSPAVSTRPTRGPNISAETRVTENTGDARGPTSSTEAHTTESSSAVSARDTKSPTIRAETRALERSPAVTTRTLRGPIISAEARSAGSSPVTATRAARGPVTPRACWR